MNVIEGLVMKWGLMLTLGYLTFVFLAKAAAILADAGAGAIWKFMKFCGKYLLGTY